MKKLILAALIFLSYVSIAYAQIGPGSTQCPQATPCYVTVTGGGGGSSTANQGTQAASATGSTWFFQQYIGGSAVSLTNAVPVQPGTGATFPVSGTVAATQSGTWNIGSVTTLPSITVSSSALPTGAATSANQTSIQSAPGTPQTTAETIQGNSSGVPVPVSVLTSSGNQSISYASPLTSVSVTTSSTSILAAATYTHFLTLCTTIASNGNVWLNLNGGTAVLSTGMYIPSNGGCISMAPPTGQVFGISDSGTDSVTIQGG